MREPPHPLIRAAALAAALTVGGCQGGVAPVAEPQLETEASLRASCLARFDRPETRQTQAALADLMNDDTVAAAECAEHGALLESIRAVDALIADDMPEQQYGFGFVAEDGP